MGSYDLRHSPIPFTELLRMEGGGYVWSSAPLTSCQASGFPPHEDIPSTHLDNDKHSLDDGVQDLDGRLAFEEAGVVTGLEDIHDKGANPKQHQPAWESGPAGKWCIR